MTGVTATTPVFKPNSMPKLRDHVSNAKGGDNMVGNVLRLRSVKDRTGLSRSSIYALIADGRFPRQISLGTRSVGWIESEVEDWLVQQISASRGDALVGGARHD